MRTGRPRIEFEMKEVQLLGRFRATYQTMAEWFECSYKTIERKMNDDNSEFCRVYKKSMATTKLKLSEAQLKYALNGNASLLIWLGKQYLDQEDKKEIEFSDNQVKEIKMI